MLVRGEFCHYAMVCTFCKLSFYFLYADPIVLYVVLVRYLEITIDISTSKIAARVTTQPPNESLKISIGCSSKPMTKIMPHLTRECVRTALTLTLSIPYPSPSYPDYDTVTLILTLILTLPGPDFNPPCAKHL